MNIMTLLKAAFMICESYDIYDVCVFVCCCFLFFLILAFVVLFWLKPGVIIRIKEQLQRCQK